MSRAVEENNRQKLVHALLALTASLETVPPFDVTQNYTFAELETFDALTSRFIRAYEAALTYFRSYDVCYAIRPADTLRDLLHNMERAGLISGIDLWLDMRLIRNKITHDYLPDQVAGFYSLICGPFGIELNRLKEKIS